MAINNASLSDGLQDKVVSFTIETAIANGETGTIGYIPCPCKLTAMQMTSFYQTGAPFLQLNISRFIPETGFTSINLGSTFTVPVFGTSGVFSLGVSLPIGSSLMYLATNDILTYQSGGGVTSGIQKLSGCFIMQPVQNAIVFLNGLS